MREHGILLSRNMARARFAGRKTQTRRAQTPRNTNKDGSPRIQPGDRIWWRETWARADSNYGLVIAYRAGGYMQYVEGEKPSIIPLPAPPSAIVCVTEGWNSSMFMPRWVARHVDPVVEVRAERLNDISDADCEAEGIYAYRDRYYWAPGSPGHRTPKEAYIALIAELHGEAFAKSNPLLWAYTFDTITNHE